LTHGLGALREAIERAPPEEHQPDESEKIPR
jgi:hypothetical protein